MLLQQYSATDCPARVFMQALCHVVRHTALSAVFARTLAQFLSFWFLLLKLFEEQRLQQ
jgi:hypothetical protein